MSTRTAITTPVSISATQLCSVLADHFPSLDSPLLNYIASLLVETEPSPFTSASIFNHSLLQQLEEYEVENGEKESEKIWQALIEKGWITEETRNGSQPVVTSATVTNKDKNKIQEKQTTLTPQSTTSSVPPKQILSSSPPISSILPTVASSPSPAPLLLPAVGLMCDARYHADLRFYTALITKKLSLSSYQVLFIEYGNTETVTVADLLNIREPDEDSLTPSFSQPGNYSKEEESKSGKLLAAPIRIVDESERKRKAREDERSRLKALAEAEELAASTRMIALSKKRTAKLLAQTAESLAKRQWDESQHKSRVAAALPIYLSTVEKMRTTRGVKLEKDVTINELTLLAPDNSELLINTEFKMVQGRRYGLIGANGRGKTTLLRQLSTYEIEEFPRYLKVQHVEQEMSGDNLTVVESVMSADIERTLLMEEEKKLTSEKKIQEITEKTPEPKKSPPPRSTNSSRASSPPIPQSSSSSSTSAADRLTVIYERLNELEAWTAESRASVILSGLGFTPAMQIMSTKDLSGGWRMRVSLACALFVNPDVLLLDEPTNHLDFPAVLWLTDYLTNHFTKTLIVVSHDRTFLNDVVTDIMYFTNQKTLEYYRGDYNNYIKVKEEKYKADKRSYEAQEMKIKHIQNYITTYYTEKKSAAQNNKIGQVLSRMKVLEKLQAEAIPDPDLERGIIITFQFPDPKPLRQPNIVTIKNLSFYYKQTKSGNNSDKNSTEIPWLLNDINVRIDIDSRIGFLGPNGSGKSTLVKLITGDLTPVEGVVTTNNAATISLFAQHHVDQLDLGLTPIEVLQSIFPGTEVEECRRHLGRFGLGAEWSLLQVGHLSGGQKSRLAFAIITWKEPHLLILDEPTNHLDMETIDGLIDSLASYKGAVLCVSHDQYFLSRVAKSYWAIAASGGGNLKMFDTLEQCKQFSYK